MKTSGKAKFTNKNNQYDFLDFGASKKESIDFGKARLFGKKGLGVDLDAVRVKKMNDSGYDCMVGDITNLDVPPKSVKFVKMSHILEHMPSLQGVEKAIISGRKAATDFLVITGPYFDEDKYLASKGFKLHWSDYPEHTCHLTAKQLIKILEKLKINDYELYLRLPFTDSSHEHVHSLKSPAGSHHYNPKIHPAKKHIMFDRNIWTDFVCYIPLKENIKNWDKITKAYNHQTPYVFMESGKPYTWSDKALSQYAELEYRSQDKDREIKELKAQNTKLTEKANSLKQQITDIVNSKSWRLITRAQRVKAKINQPAGKTYSGQ